MKGMALMVQEGEKWTQLGVRTQNDGATRHFEALYFDVPEKYVAQDQTVFRLFSKNGDEVNVYHLWMYKLEGGKSESLPELLGFVANQDVGAVSHGLIPKGKEWKSPLLLSQHPDQAALIVLKVGKGFIIRSELALEDSLPMFRALLNDQTRDDMEETWSGS